MNSRLLLSFFALFAVAVGLRAEATAPVNVLFIVVDDLNTVLGCYGNAVVKSPNIDRLAARGVRFDRTYCQYPLCNPSRASFLSGRRPETTGIYILSKAVRAALPDAVMLPQFFRDRGYFTAGAGKVFHNAKVSDPKSWDFYEDGSSSDPEEQAAIKARGADAGGDGRPAWQVLSSDGSQTRDGVNGRTIARLMREQQAAQKPFFLAAGFHKPHLPWTAPKRFFDLYPDGAITAGPEPEMVGVPAIALQTELSGFEQPASRADAMRGYYACVSFTDDNVGRLLGELDRLDLWKTTVVVLIGDNGFHLGDHGGLWAKLSAFEESTRVPFIIAGAGVPVGVVVRSPVELLDVYPTLVELGGFPAAPELEGRSLVALMRGQEKATTHLAQSMVFHYDVAAKRDVLSRTLIAEHWRYTEWEGGAAGSELYLRTAGAGEYVNRVGDAAGVDAAQEGRAAMRKLATPKAGSANRPRALVPAGQRVN